MRLFLDIDSREFLQSPSFPRALTTLALKRRDTDLIELQFVRDRTVQELPASTTIRLGLKPSAAYTAEFLATGTFTKDGTGTAARYLLDLNLNTVALNTAFAAATPEPVTLAAMLEVEWTSGTNISSSLTLPVTIANDVIRGDEGEPVNVPLFYSSATSDLKATQAQAEAGTDNLTWMSPLRTKQALAPLSEKAIQSYTLNGSQTPSGIGPGQQLFRNTVGSPVYLSDVIYAMNGSTPVRLDAELSARSSWAAITSKPTTFPPAAHTHPLSALTQSSATTGQVATWNGTAWVPQTPAAGEGGGLPSQNPTISGQLTVNSGDSLFITGQRVTSEFASFIDFEEGRFNYNGRDVFNWVAASPGLLINSPLVVSGDEDLFLTGNEIRSNYGPTVFQFEEAQLMHAGNQVLQWGNAGQLSVASRTLKDLGAPVDANDAVRKIDIDNKVANAGGVAAIQLVTSMPPTPDPDTLYIVIP
jgi:hypothetical protein